MSVEKQRGLRLPLAWIDKHVPVPERFNRTTSKGWYRRETRGISWLRAAATEALETFRALAEAVRSCGFPVAEFRETRVGYVVHEDELQVVAEPFATRERASRSRLCVRHS